MILVPPQKIAEYTERGWWGRKTLWEVFEAQVVAHPGALAVADAANRADFAHGAPRRLTWAELAGEVDRFCALLLDAGVRRDEVIVVQMPNGVEQFVVYLACARLGIVVSPVPVQYREHELEYILRATRAAAAVCFSRIGRAGTGHAAASLFLALRAAHPALRVVLAWGEALPAGVLDAGAAGAVPLSAAVRARVSRAAEAAAVTANDVFTVCWTSGTEARPKGVPRSHNEWLIIAPSIIEAGGIAPGARLLNPFPLVNMAGFSTAFAAWLCSGSTLVQHHPFTLPVFLQQLREEAIDYTVAPPAVLNMLLQNPALLEGVDFSRLRRIGSGSAPLSEWMVRGFAERYGVEIVNYFGSNEGAAFAATPRDIPDPGERARFFPRAGVPGYDWSVSTYRKIRTRLVDVDTGQDIHEAGRAGEVRFAGPTIFSGYWGEPERSARAFDAQGYYCTGDLFEIAGERLEYYRYVGRSKDLVIRGGMNISSEELEGLLVGCPGVRDAAVIGVPDPVLGEKVCACVVPAADQAPSLGDIIGWLRDRCRVAVYKLPEYLMVLPELPRNPVGKVLKRELRERARGLAPEERS